MGSTVQSSNLHKAGESSIVQPQWRNEERSQREERATEEEETNERKRENMISELDKHLRCLRINRVELPVEIR